MVTEEIDVRVVSIDKLEWNLNTAVIQRPQTLEMEE